MLSVALVVAPHLARAQSPNLGDPLFCQPQEGTTFLIVNGGAGVFSVDPDCYNENTANDTTLTIVTTQGGSLAGTRGPTAINYVYTPPTPGFVGTDTFTIPVTTVFNAAGGTGSAGGTVRPGGPATLTITLNVIPATTTLTPGGAAITLPVPAGSVTGCTAPGNSGQGPAPGAVVGCVTGIIAGTTAPAHGTLTTSGNTLIYHPAPGYIGVDSFNYQAVGLNTDGTNALNSGNVTVTVNETVAVAPLPTTLTLPLIGLACIVAFESFRRYRRAAQR